MVRRDTYDILIVKHFHNTFRIAKVCIYIYSNIDTSRIKKFLIMY